MVRIAGVNIPEQKRADIALTYLYGIGPSNSKAILKKANINKEAKVNQLSSKDIDLIREVIEKNYIVEGDLRQKENQNIRRLKEINSYRGNRHKKNLPVRGQRTRTNARTKRGKRVTVGSGRKKPAEKT